MVRNGYQHMVLDDYVDKVRRISRERRLRLEQITTRGQAEAYQEYVREAIHSAFSPRPPKTELNARVTGVVERPAYRIEKVILESRPGCLVTANLYIPNRLKEAAPACWAPVGTVKMGKRAICIKSSASGWCGPVLWCSSMIRSTKENGISITV